MEGRIRFCLSAAHTKEQLDMVYGMITIFFNIKLLYVKQGYLFQALDVIEERANTLGLRYSQLPREQGIICYGTDGVSC